MIIIGLVLSAVGIGFFCCLLFMLAVYALPFFVGLTAGLAAFHGGSGVIGALVVGALGGGATLAVGQIAFASVRTPLARAAIALVYAAPAALAGYHATLGLAHIGLPAEGWRQALAVIGAVCIGATAMARMSLFAPPNPGAGRRWPFGSVAVTGGSNQPGVRLGPSSSMGAKSGR